MVGENFEIYLSWMVKNTFKLSTMVGENFEIYLSWMIKNTFKLSMVKNTYFHSKRLGNLGHLGQFAKI